MKAKFILNKQKLIGDYNSLKAKCDFVYYSFKTNIEVGQVLEEFTYSNFSVHTIADLKRLKDFSRVLFFAQAWNKSEIKDLISRGITRFVVDNESDLNVFLNSISSEKLTLFLRMRLKEHTVQTGKHFVFGFYVSEINRLISQLKEYSNLTLGIHFHRKTQNIHEWSLKYELQESLTEETLSSIKFINIGGGIPIHYKNSRAETEHIFNEINELRIWLKQKNIQLIIEPGRFLAAPCIKLKSQIINIYNNNIIINCSVYNSSMDTFIAGVRLEVEEELNYGEPYTIKGCTPDSIDIFRYRIFLDNPKVGDVITFLNAGAYNFHSNFCNLEKLETEIEF